MQWHILDTGVCSAEENMRRDAELLEGVERPTLHLYDWAGDSATYGYFTDPGEFLHLDEVERRGITLARRPTGGGIVFHMWDLAFSVAVPSSSELFSENTLDNYELVNEVIKRCVRGAEKAVLVESDGGGLSRFCMAQPTRYDVVLEGRKIAGAAQRKTRKGFLHQGTIAILMPDVEILGAVLREESEKEAMLAHTFALTEDRERLGDIRLELKELLKKEFIHV